MSNKVNRSKHIKHLEQLQMEQYKNRYPSVPDHAIPRPKYQHTKSNGLTKAICDYIDLLGGWATRINTMGVYRDGRWTKSTTKLGTADIWAQYNNTGYAIEVKIGADKQSEEQKQVQREFTKAKSGGVYIIAKTFDQFYEDFNNTINNNK